MQEKVDEQRLLNDFQHDFPLEPEPFSAIARELSCSVGGVLNALDALQTTGAISRVGPVFKPNSVGASTLAAMSVPGKELESVAALISGYPQVNHNYEREHAYNLWFVLAESDTDALHNTVSDMEAQCGYPILTLPLVKAYHIDLGFDLTSGQQKSPPARERDTSDPETIKSRNQTLSAVAQQVVAATQFGLPLVNRPYQAIAEQLNLTESQVIEELQQLQANGTIKRMGVIVRHRELGYSANAMVVWDVPAERVDDVGVQLGQHERVNLCYQRPSQPPDWRYNLFCMIHGKRRDEVVDCVEAITAQHKLHELPRDILFSNRCFKQRGATYFRG